MFEEWGVVDILRNSSMLVKGTLSWFTVNRANDEGRIITFDKGNEVAYQIPKL